MVKKCKTLTGILIGVSFQYEPRTMENNVTDYNSDSNQNFSTIIVTSGFEPTDYPKMKGVSIFCKLLLLDLLPYIVISVLNGIIVTTIFRSSKRIHHYMVSLILLCDNFMCHARLFFLLLFRTLTQLTKDTKMIWKLLKHLSLFLHGLYFVNASNSLVTPI